MAEPFLHAEFLLSTEVSRRLYHEYAEGLPIFDYHCHLPVAEVADNRGFENHPHRHRNHHGINDHQTISQRRRHRVECCRF